MQYTDIYTSKRTGHTFDIVYKEVDSFEHISHLPIKAAGAFCFCDGKLVLVYAKKRDCWEIPGGGREEGESFDACIVREIKEESNMKVLKLVPLGYDTFTNRDNGDVLYILRYGALVEPYGDFVADGDQDADITAMQLIDPKDYKTYFDWNERGDAMLGKSMRLLGV